MAMRYEFYLKAPAETLFLRIGERDQHGTLMVASFTGARRRLSTHGLIASCLAVPMLGLKVIGAIHFEALRLWLKGLRPFARPAPPMAASFGSAGAYSLGEHESACPRAAASTTSMRLAKRTKFWNLLLRSASPHRAA